VNIILYGKDNRNRNDNAIDKFMVCVMARHPEKNVFGVCQKYLWGNVKKGAGLHEVRVWLHRKINLVNVKNNWEMSNQSAVTWKHKFWEC